MDGVKLGMSSRALGQLEEKDDANYVKEMRLVAIDCVADPSFPKAFVNGILESKQYVLNNYGQYVEAYENLELGLSNLPRKDVESYIKNSVLTFLDAIKKKI